MPKDPTRLAAIKAMKPTPGPWTRDAEDEFHDLIVAAADPDYGLQALAAEVERLQEREKGVKMSCDSPDNRACTCGGWPLLNWSYCPDCGRRLEWA